MRKTTRLLLLTVSILLVSCSTIPDHIPGVYRLDIEQGNIIDQTMIDELRPNMTKRQVLYILGSPMLIDVFHQKRWDYIYSKQPGGEARQQQRISLFFKDDLLAGVQGDYRPSTLPVAKIKTDTTVDVPKREEKKTVFGEIVKFFTFDDEPSEKKEIESTEEIEVEAEEQAKLITPEQELTAEGVEIQPLPDMDQDIQAEPDTDLESIEGNQVEQETLDENALEAVTSEPDLPEQQATDIEQTVIEKTEEIQPLPDMDIQAVPDADLKSIEENQVEQETLDENTLEAVASEPDLPEQQATDIEQPAIEKTEEIAIEETKEPEDTFSKQVDELSKPPVIQNPE